jgi:hypothetical protein
MGTDLMPTLDDELVPDLPDVPGERVPVHGAPAVSQRLPVAPQVQGSYATAGQSSQLLSCQAPGQACCTKISGRIRGKNLCVPRYMENMQRASLRILLLRQET